MVNNYYKPLNENNLYKKKAPKDLVRLRERKLKKYLKLKEKVDILHKEFLEAHKNLLTYLNL
jgi:hypothetical protein